MKINHILSALLSTLLILLIACQQEQIDAPISELQPNYCIEVRYEEPFLTSLMGHNKRYYIRLYYLHDNRKELLDSRSTEYSSEVDRMANSLLKNADKILKKNRQKHRDEINKQKRLDSTLNYFNQKYNCQ